MRRVSGNAPPELRPFRATDVDCFVNPGLRPGLWNLTPSGSELCKTAVKKAGRSLKVVANTLSCTDGNLQQTHGGERGDEQHILNEPGAIRLFGRRRVEGLNTARDQEQQ
jgi:hypothetical protein